MFEYHSHQVHTSVVNGKGTTKINSVDVKGDKGTKEVVEKNAKGKVLRRTRRKLRKIDICRIKNEQFIPGLFSDCKIKTVCKKRK